MFMSFCRTSLKSKVDPLIPKGCSSHCKLSYIYEGLPGVLGNKGTKGKFRRAKGNMTPVLGNTGTQTSKTFFNFLRLN